MEPHLKDLGKLITDKLQENIRGQKLPWEPLKPSTAARKGHSLVYLDSWEMVRSIRASVVRKGTFNMELIVKPEGDHAGSGKSMESLAYILEYGTPRISARPLWRPTLAQLGDLAKTGPMRDFLDRLRF
jgi:hypothetical protein